MNQEGVPDMDRMMRRTGARAAALAGLIVAGWVPAATLTLDISGVRSADGLVVVSVCDEPRAPIPGGCATYKSAVAASQGTVAVRIDDMKPGRYAIQAYHDENGNSRADIPGEGFVFGNDTPWPPAFEPASVQ